MEAEISSGLRALTIDTASRPPQQATLLRLPLEMRHRIYHYALIHTLYLSPKDVYFAGKSLTRLPPASLYFVNWQIRSELQAVILAKSKDFLVLHVTPRGTLYSSFSETQILAGKSRDIAQASKIYLRIWPPHPDRPVEIFDIWRSAREIQRQLIQAAPLQDFRLEFFNNEIASWCPNGRILDTLLAYGSSEAEGRDDGFNDMTELAEVFCRVRASSARVSLPPEVKMPGAFPETLQELYDISSMMKGKCEVPDIYHKEITPADKKRIDHHEVLRDQEEQLKIQGARITVKKITEMTRDIRKLSVMEWWHFLETCNPQFDLLHNALKSLHQGNAPAEGEAHGWQSAGQTSLSDT